MSVSQLSLDDTLLPHNRVSNIFFPMKMAKSGSVLLSISMIQTKYKLMLNRIEIFARKFGMQAYDNVFANNIEYTLILD